MRCNECKIVDTCKYDTKCTSCVYVEFKVRGTDGHFWCSEINKHVKNSNVEDTCDKFRCMTFIPR